jgi:uncharacterized protein
MSFDTLEAALTKVFGSTLPGSQLTIIWHAGEPFVLPASYYETAFAIVEHQTNRDVHVSHSFQTNATLINDEWCVLIRRKDIRIGVSIDGPDWLHDRYRKTRKGAGTHSSMMRGVEKLQEYHVPFHVICVLTRDSLDHPDEIFDFFVQLRPQMLCFNIEETEGVNLQSSLASTPVESNFRRFFQRIIDRFRHELPPFRIREIDDVLMALRNPAFGALNSNSQNEPFSILSIAYDGSFSTFSPELLGLSHPAYRDLAFGNVLRSDFIEALGSPNFDHVWSDIRGGIERCKASCKYFSFCRGGAPVNKLAELGTFNGTETMFCRLTQKAVIDCVLAALDQDLQGSKSVSWFMPKELYAPFSNSRL